MLTEKRARADRKLKLSMQTLRRLDAWMSSTTEPTDDSCVAPGGCAGYVTQVGQIDDQRGGQHPG